VLLLLRIAFAVLVTTYIIWDANPAAVGGALAGASWSWIGGACLLVLCDRALMAYRWIALLAPLAPGQRPPLRALLRIFFVSTFVGSFLPQSVGTDAVRAVSLTRGGVSGSASLASVLVDRLLGVVAIVICAAGGVLALWLAAGDASVLTQTWIWIAFAAASAGCLVGVAVIFSARVDDLLRRLARRLPTRVGDLAERALLALRAYQGHRGVLMTVLWASIAVQVLRVLQAWVLGRSVDIALGPAMYFVFVPIVLLVMLLPITISGLGVSQWAFQTLFARVGVAAPPALALSILFVALGLVGNLPGALLYVAGPKKPT
jgi:uncharacterized protein (TIRG00374 family)